MKNITFLRLKMLYYLVFGVLIANVAWERWQTRKFNAMLECQNNEYLQRYFYFAANHRLYRLLLLIIIILSLTILYLYIHQKKYRNASIFVIISISLFTAFYIIGMTKSILMIACIRVDQCVTRNAWFTYLNC